MRERPAAAPTLTSIRNVDGSGIGSVGSNELEANDSGPNANSGPTMIVVGIIASIDSSIRKLEQAPGVLAHR